MGGFNSGITRLIAGANITIDETNPAQPEISASGGGGGGGLANVLAAGYFFKLQSTDLPLSADDWVYDNGASGVGATITITIPNGDTVIVDETGLNTDTGTPLLSRFALVNAEYSDAFFYFDLAGGIYELTSYTVGGSDTVIVLTRTTDCDTTAKAKQNLSFSAQVGVLYAGVSFTLRNSDTFVLGTDLFDIAFVTDNQLYAFEQVDTEKALPNLGLSPSDDVNFHGLQLTINSADHSEDCTGVATLVAGTVTVACQNISDAETSIFLTRKNKAGGIGELSVENIVGGTSFDIVSTDATETSTVQWLLIFHDPL